MRLVPLLGAVAVVLALALPSVPKAATIEYSFFGTLDIALDDLNGITAPAGTVFTGRFRYSDNALALDGGIYGRPYQAISMEVWVEGNTRPIVDTNRGIGAVSVNVTPYGDVYVPFRMASSGPEVGLAGSLNIFAAPTPQVVNPLLLLPGEFELETFAIAGLSFGTVDALTMAFDNEFQGTIDRIVTTPLPAGVWLFLSAMAGLGILGYRRRWAPSGP